MDERKRCPVCRAPFRGVVNCPRCGADLRRLMLIAIHVVQLKKKALQALGEGRFEAARYLAGQLKPLRNHKSEHQLQRVIELLSRS